MFAGGGTFLIERMGEKLCSGVENLGWWDLALHLEKSK